MERALSFGSVAAAYHRHRPGYPDEVADLALAHAAGPVRRALEVGAGTGKATALFAGRGVDVVAVEPDPGMRAVLAAQVREHAWPVEVVAATYEDLDPGRSGRFDLLYAAAAFHWTDPATRLDRAAALLRPGGVLALFGIARDLADDDLRRRVDELTSAVTHEDATTRPHAGWAVADLEAHPLLEAAVEHEVPGRTRMTADDYVAHLATVSMYVVLPPPRRDALLLDVRALLPAEVEVTEDVPLHLARRVA